MKITNRMVVDSVGALNELSELHLPVKTAFKLAKVSRKIHGILESYNEVLGKLQQTHAKRDEDEKVVSLPDPRNPRVQRIQFEDPDAFQKAYDELLDIESEIEFSKLTMASLGKIEVKPSTIFSIDWIFHDED